MRLSISKEDLELARKLGIHVEKEVYPSVWAGEGHIYVPTKYLVDEKDYIKLKEAKFGKSFIFKIEEADHYVAELASAYIAEECLDLKMTWTGNTMYIFGKGITKEKFEKELMRMAGL